MMLSSIREIPEESSLSMKISEQELQAVRYYLRPVPTPGGYTSREIVRRAIEFDDPPRVPYSFIQPLESDFAEMGAIASAFWSVGSIPKGELRFDEWGVGWRGSGRSWGHADVTPLSDLSTFDTYRFPTILTQERIDLVKMFVDEASRSGKYVVGGDPIMPIERLRSLMGYENLMLAMYTDRERFEGLLDRLANMAIEVIQTFGEIGGVDGYMAVEDWGLQTSLQIRPAQWREIFRPRYARMVKAAHDSGMHYLWHCCGYIWDIITDMIEIGVDVLQIDQPRLMGVDRLAEEFGSKICFWNPVDIQWSTSEGVTDDDAAAEAKHMIEAFGRFKGGFLARQYPQPNDIEISQERHRAIYEAFMEAGCRTGDS
jgi:uroporphyrinogen decarboxylase